MQGSQCSCSLVSAVSSKAYYLLQIHPTLSHRHSSLSGWEVTYALLDDLILIIHIYLFVFDVFHIYCIHLMVLVLHVGVALPGRTGAHWAGAQPAQVCTNGTGDADAASSGDRIADVELYADGTDTAVGATAAAVATHLHTAGFAKKVITKYY